MAGSSKSWKIAGTIPVYVEVGYHAVMTWRTLKIQDCGQSAGKLPIEKLVEPSTTMLR